MKPILLAFFIVALVGCEYKTNQVKCREPYEYFQQISKPYSDSLQRDNIAMDNLGIENLNEKQLDTYYRNLDICKMIADMDLKSLELKP